MVLGKLFFLHIVTLFLYTSTIMLFKSRIFQFCITLLSIVGYGYFAFAVLTPGQTLDPVGDMLCTGPTDPACEIIFQSPVTIGDPIVNASLDGILYTDDDSNLITDLNFTRDNTSGETLIAYQPAPGDNQGLLLDATSPGGGSFSGSFFNDATGSNAYNGVFDLSALKGSSDYLATAGMIAQDSFGNTAFTTLIANAFSVLLNDNNDNETYFDMTTESVNLRIINNQNNHYSGILIDSNGLSFTDENVVVYTFPLDAGSNGEVLTTDGSGVLSWGAGSPISIGTSGNTLYSSGLTGTGQGDTSIGDNIILGVNAGDATSVYDSNFFGESAGQNATEAYQSNFFGSFAGYEATYASDSNFLGFNAGSGAENAMYSNFLGLSAGDGATNASQSNFLGASAGLGATGAANSNFLGSNAGSGATSAAASNFLGSNAGLGATGAANSNFLGSSAGNGATGAYNSNFFGQSAGNGATGAQSSNFFGQSAGNGATGASYSNFIGQNSGQGATGAIYSNFIGWSAGNGAATASNSIFIGKNSGLSDTVNNTGSASNYSILIGPLTSTGGYSNSIAIGGFATNTATNQLMVGSSTRRIEELVFNGGAGNTCSIVAGTGISCSSDERLKTNITDLDTDTLEKINNLRTVTFNWKEGVNQNTQIGFIAQNINEYFPELVSTNHDGMLAVNYAGMTPVLTQAIRELDLKITNIESFSSSVDTTFIENVRNWLGDIGNGIALIIADTLKARNQICIDDVCMTKDQLRDLLEQGNGYPSEDSSTSENTSPEPEVTTPESSDESVPESTPEVTSESPVVPEISEPIEIIEPTEPSPESSSEPVVDTL